MKFTLNRDKVVASEKGHAVSFAKGEPTHVPPEMYDEVMAVGAVPEDELAEPVKTGKEVPTDEREREEVIMPVLASILLRNDRDDFTASGVPKVEVISAGAGFRVSDRERSALWEKLKKGTEE